MSSGHDIPEENPESIGIFVNLRRSDSAREARKRAGLWGKVPKSIGR